MNVAITRAKKQFILIANAETLGREKQWASFMQNFEFKLINEANNNPHSKINQQEPKEKINKESIKIIITNLKPTIYAGLSSGKADLYLNFR